MELPTQRSEVSIQLDKILMLIYGQPKIGKSTLAASFPDAIFASTEPGLRFLSVYKVDITTWADFLELGFKLLNNEVIFKTIIIDTIDLLYKLCEEYICKEWKIDHPNDMAYGKGWSILRSEFQRPILQLAAKFGIVFISHSKEIEIKARVETFTKTMSTMAEGARKALLPLVDVIGLLTAETKKDSAGNIVGEEHVFLSESNKYLETGARASSDAKFPSRIVIPQVGGYKAIVQAVKELNNG